LRDKEYGNKESEEELIAGCERNLEGMGKTRRTETGKSRRSWEQNGSETWMSSKEIE